MSDLGWVERLLDRPPSCLSELERHVGRLDVDFAGGEGFGHLVRPDRRTPPSRAGLRAGVTHLEASFYFDMYHERPERPREMQLRSLALDLDTGHATLARMLERRFGRGRTVARGDVVHAEHGAWFYLSANPDASARLQWEHVRPEWALPPVAPSSREEILATVVDRVVYETTEGPLAAAIEPLAAAAGAAVTRLISGGLAIDFRPGLPLAMVVAAFRWEEPIAWSGDVHRSSWAVAPRSAVQSRPWLPILGCWQIEAQLDGWPRGPGRAQLPELDVFGPSPSYDLRTCENAVARILILPHRE
ncbi:MAG TPA: hypothetical protein VK932_13575 [Kofleriaceae bacterium]|nr:hypothetical protein [Kofleriaceae bacterium]